MKTGVRSLLAEFDKFQAQWSPQIVGQMNDYHFKLARIQGDFTWHRHPETDEAFLVLEGSMRIDFRDDSVTLKAGDLYVVPKGIEHKPFAEKECKILLIEPAGTVNTGNAGGPQTADTGNWLA